MRRREIVRDPKFRLLDKDNDDIVYPSVAPELAFPLLNLRKPVLALDIFLSFIDSKLIQKIWDHGLQQDSLYWTYAKGKPKDNRTIGEGKCDLQTIYAFLAYQLRIIGLQNKPSESNPTVEPLQNSYREARNHFGNMLFGERFNASETCIGLPGIKICKHLNGHFLINHLFYDDLSVNFRKVIKCFGEFVAGDEKLFRFTGMGEHLRQVLSKPG